MIFDGIVFGAYIGGSILIFTGMLLRYGFDTGKSGKVVRWIHTIKVVDPRENKPDALGLLFQSTGVLWLLLGTVYGIILRRFVVEGILSVCLDFLILFGPETLLIGVVAFLRRFYWQR